MFPKGASEYSLNSIEIKFDISTKENLSNFNFNDASEKSLKSNQNLTDFLLSKCQILILVQF
jgi:hypothetical protein